MGAGGQLSGPLSGLGADDQQRAILSLLELRGDIGLPDPRSTVPVMADLARRNPHLNLLNLVAAATARTLDGTMWHSKQSAGGVLPSVLDADGLRWTTVEIT